jgi:cell division protein FtsZ
LEDIDLQGAHGILVNITAKDMDLTEFDEIGSIMHAFASEEADMKIGTAINPDMGDEIKVTVVATGMGKSVAVDSAINVVKKASVGDINYDVLDKPTVIRHNAKEKQRETRFGAQPKQDVNLDYLDVPAFLRRQAD